MKKIQRKPLRIAETNKKLKNIQESIFERVVTENIYLQQKYPNLIVERKSGDKFAGQIRTYAEYKQTVLKRASTNALEKASLDTYEEYYKKVQQLKEDIKNRITLYKEEKFQRDYMIQSLKNHGQGDIDFSQFTTKELLKAFRDAEEIQRTESKELGGQYDSYRFWEDIRSALDFILQTRGTEIGDYYMRDI